MKMGSGSMVRSLERKSSIETEPRTLNLSQIRIAREAALHVVSTRSEEEALRIFTAGLKPVVSGSRDESEEDETRYDDYYEFEEYKEGLSCSEIRDIASAPKIS